MVHCPGWYCGRQYLPDGSLSECGSCPRGFRRNSTSFICEPCLDTPTLYDWLYLGFMVILVLILHWFFIDMVLIRRKLTKQSLMIFFCAFVEVLLAGIFSILFSHPFGSFTMYSCNVRHLSDWYTFMHNPTSNYERTIHCTNEAVYPLYTIVFVFYAFSLIFMLILRPWVVKKYLPKRTKMSVYAALYFIPILALIHALISGLLYYAFPVLIIILSVISCATYFAGCIRQTAFSLILTTVTDLRNVIILLGHWTLHGYGILAITHFSVPSTFHACFLLAIPVPTIFYILTSRFTDPNKI